MPSTSHQKSTALPQVNIDDRHHYDDDDDDDDNDSYSAPYLFVITARPVYFSMPVLSGPSVQISGVGLRGLLLASTPYERVR